MSDKSDEYQTPEEGGEGSDFEVSQNAKSPKKKKLKTPKKATNGKKTPKKSNSKTSPPKTSSGKRGRPRRKREPSAEILEESDPLGGIEQQQDPEEEYEVEKIVGHHLNNGLLTYKIRWKGYSANADTWENYFDLNCPDLLEAYNFKNDVDVPGKLFKPGKKRKAGRSKSKKSSRGRPKVVAKKKKKSSDSESSDESDKWVGDGESDDEYEVEKIIDVRNKKNGAKEFLVKWKNWGPEYDSWEPEKHLQCSELIEKFFNKQDKEKDIDARELREVRKHTDRFTLQTHENGRRLSKRASHSQRRTYYDAADSDADE